MNNMKYKYINKWTIDIKLIENDNDYTAGLQVLWLLAVRLLFVRFGGGGGGRRKRKIWKIEATEKRRVTRNAVTRYVILRHN